MAGLGGGLSQLEGRANEQLTPASVRPLLTSPARSRLVLAGQEPAEVRLVQQVSV